MGELRYSSTMLVLGTRWRKVVSFIPHPTAFSYGILTSSAKWVFGCVKKSIYDLTKPGFTVG
jgi:hypothetical protein